MKWIWLLFAAVVLALAASYSSQYPDAVEHLLGLPGGTKGITDGLLGILAAGVAVVGILKVIKRK